MKLTKIDYKIACDCPGCNELSTYCLTFHKTNTKVHFCKKCLKELKSEIKNVGV